MTTTPNDSAEQIKRLADDYAHVYSYMHDDTMPRRRTELHAAIDALAALAQPVPAADVPKVQDSDHKWQTCKVTGCEICQANVEDGFVMACDECGSPGHTDSDGWVMAVGGEIYCQQCAASIDGVAPPPAIPTNLESISTKRLDPDFEAILSDNLPQLYSSSTPAPPAIPTEPDDLPALVARLARALRKAAPDNDLADKALDYLKRKGLQGSPLRSIEPANGLELAARFIEDRACSYDAEHGTTDPETGTREYPGNGEEYYGELIEIADAIRGLAPTAQPVEQTALTDERILEIASCLLLDKLYVNELQVRRQIVDTGSTWVTQDVLAIVRAVLAEVAAQGSAT